MSNRKRRQIQKIMEEEYLATLLPKQKKAYDVAVRILGCSFNLKKSVGYREWKQACIAVSPPISNGPSPLHPKT